MAVVEAVLLTAGVVVLFVVEECADNKTVFDKIQVFKPRHSEHSEVSPAVGQYYDSGTLRYTRDHVGY
ncbi:hypothetical protein Lche_1646 [Legionella cherrii]|uniref:Uncharacterized protein n=1 Tax=Legionella cherrii TaxID=28084 RepID=A0A0W0S8F5_9GAMM|nr:hypothetical protein [Legionella cherrii]KTC79626.1 hypothetical protein Lche_1646 [Legionella cherrii]